MEKCLCVGILGAGSWGTALAIHLAKKGHTVHLWGRNSQQQRTLADSRCNQHYLPNHTLPDSIVIRDNFSQTIAESEWLVLALPAVAVHTIITETLPFITPTQQGLICTAKGMDQEQGLFMHQVIAPLLDPSLSVAYLSGPSFSNEVAAGLPTAITMVADDINVADRAAALFHSKTFRVYTSTDVVGVEVAGALKNVIAIATGVSDGLGYGANARAALITRGLSEIRRFALQLGASPNTLSGLAGLGDLVLTCTAEQSRNYRYGKLLASGSSNTDAQQTIGQVVEGASTAQIIFDLAQRQNIELPICFTVRQILYGGLDIKQAVNELLNRDAKSED